MSKVLYMDLNRCISCLGCEVACMRVHGNGTSNIFVTLLEDRFSIPLSCRHCEKSPCVEVCPTGALEKTSEGAVIQHSMKCIGCTLCAVVCPFGIIQLDTVNKVIQKCDLCIYRLSEDKLPACVATCPARAITYDEFDTIMENVRKKRAMSILSGVGTEPGTIMTLPAR
ncbi:MAG: 4Fe-4S dicluster domain-containing protein [Methanomicrobia archaeon]|nr:4Fe-4S dicluster domain-containing protein [Methanomicrobia archaeon]